MHSSQIEGDIDMDTIHPQKSNVMVECNREREDICSSKRLKGSKERLRSHFNRLFRLGVKEVGDIVDAQSQRIWGLLKPDIYYAFRLTMGLFGNNYKISQLCKVPYLYTQKNNHGLIGV